MPSDKGSTNVGEFRFFKNVNIYRIYFVFDDVDSFIDKPNKIV